MEVVYVSAGSDWEKYFLKWVDYYEYCGRMQTTQAVSNQKLKELNAMYRKMNDFDQSCFHRCVHEYFKNMPD